MWFVCGQREGASAPPESVAELLQPREPAPGLLTQRRSSDDCDCAARGAARTSQGVASSASSGARYAMSLRRRPSASEWVIQVDYISIYIYLYMYIYYLSMY